MSISIITTASAIAKQQGNCISKTHRDAESHNLTRLDNRHFLDEVRSDENTSPSATSAKSFLHPFLRILGNAIFCFIAISAAISSPVSAQSSGIQVSIVPARTSGVAPLAAFFDATATTDQQDTSYPFHELDYSWNFGDSGAGTWSYGNSSGTCGAGMGSQISYCDIAASLPAATNSKNVAYGPVAAHVFESPGTYSVCLTVKGASGSASTCQTITVSDPNIVFAGTKTTCVSASSLPIAGSGGCPSGAAVAQQADWPTILNTYAASGTVRVLLKAGDTFTLSASGRLADTTGPCTIDSYGSGAQPAIQPQVNLGVGHQILSLATGVTDCRIRNLNFDGSYIYGIDGAASTLINGFAGVGNSAKQILLENLTGTDLCNGINYLYLGTDAMTVDQFFVVGTTIQNLTCPTGGNAGQFGIYGGMQRSAWLGNDWENSISGQEVYRIQLHNKIVISHNYLARALSSKGILLIHGDSVCGSPAPTTCTPLTSGQDVISDNVIIADWAQSSPGFNDAEALGYNEPIKDTIWERNFFVSGKVNSTDIQLSASNVSIRLNIFNFLASNTNVGGFAVSPYWGTCTACTPQRTLIPQPTNLWHYNNIFYSDAPTTSNNYTMISLQASGSPDISALGAVTIQNNLMYAKNSSNPKLFTDSTPASNPTTCTSCNSSNAQAKSTDPLFINGSGAFTAPADFTPNTGSYAIAAGANVPVYYDFFRTPFPQGGANNIGAIQRGALPPASLHATATTGTSASGNQGGPFTPASITYDISASPGTAGFSISGVPTWLAPSTTSGIATTLPTPLTFTVNASSLTPGAYAASIALTNTDTGVVNTTLVVTLTVTPLLAPPPPPDPLLSVAVSGNGTVTSSPAGINCGTTCNAGYAGGAQVNLSATPRAGSAFSGWGGACSGTGTCSVTMNSAETVSAIFTITSPPPSQAGRTWVSAALGNDSNPCTRMSPCLTFAGALAKTMAGGEIDVLDPGDFGSVTITQAVSIYNDTPRKTGVLTSSGTGGIIVSAGANDIINLRGIVFDGGNQQGASGIVFNSGAQLHIQNCAFKGFGTSAIMFSPGAGSAAGAQIGVQDTTIVSNGTGIVIKPTGTIAVNAFLNRIRVDKNSAAGIVADGRGGSGAINVALSDSSTSLNASTGVSAVSGTGNVTVQITRLIAASNGLTGVQSDQSNGGIATVTIGRSALYGSGSVAQSIGGGTLLSHSDNQISGTGGFSGAASLQ